MLPLHLARVPAFILALIILATGMAPANADTPPSTPVPQTAAERIKAGIPGALEQWQLEQMKNWVSQGLSGYQSQTGRWPATVDELLAAGLLPIRPLLIDGTVCPIIALGHGELPPVGAIGMRLRDNDCTLIRMGADGDPLSPMTATVERSQGKAPWLAPYPWTARLASAEERSLAWLVPHYVELTGEMPSTLPALLAEVGLTLVDATVSDQLATPDCGVTLERSGDGEYLRTVRYPDPGFAQICTYELLHPQGPGDRYSIWDALPPDPTAIEWHPIGTFAFTGDLPTELATWQLPVVAPPRAPAETPVRFVRWPRSPRYPVLMSDFQFYGALQYAATQRVASGEWLLQETHLLHQPLGPDGQPRPWAVSPNTGTPRGSSTIDRPAGSPYEFHALVGAYESESDGRVTPMVGLDLPIDEPLPAELANRPGGVPRGRGGGSSYWPHFWSPGKYVYRSYMRPLPTEAERNAVRAWLAQESSGMRRVLEDWLWQADTGSTEHFEVLFAQHAGECLAIALREWLKVDGHTDAPESWDAVLDELMLAPNGYAVLGTGQSAGANQLWCELALDPTQRYLRCRVRLPNGQAQEWYTTGREQQGDSFILDAIRLRQYPETTTLTYQPVATFAIDIPHPPATGATP